MLTQFFLSFSTHWDIFKIIFYKLVEKYQLLILIKKNQTQNYYGICYLTIYLITFST